MNFLLTTQNLTLFVREVFQRISCGAKTDLKFVRLSAGASQKVSLLEIIYLQRAYITTKPWWSDKKKTDAMPISDISFHLLLIGKIHLVFTYF